MKPCRFASVCLILLVVSLGTVRAQTSSLLQGTNAAVIQQYVKDRLEFMARTLQMTEDQKLKARPILEEETKKIMELRTLRNSGKNIDWQAKFKEVRDTASTKLKLILTPVQWQKYVQAVQGRYWGWRGTNSPPNRPQTQTR